MGSSVGLCDGLCEGVCEGSIEGNVVGVRVDSRNVGAVDGWAIVGLKVGTLLGDDVVG